MLLYHELSQHHDGNTVSRLQNDAPIINLVLYNDQIIMLPVAVRDLLLSHHVVILWQFMPSLESQLARLRFVYSSDHGRFLKYFLFFFLSFFAFYFSFFLSSSSLSSSLPFLSFVGVCMCVCLYSV